MNKATPMVILFGWYGIFDTVRFRDLIVFIHKNHNPGNHDIDQIESIVKNASFESYLNGRRTPQKFWYDLGTVLHISNISEAHKSFLMIKRNEYLWKRIGNLYEYRLGILSNCPKDKKVQIINNLKKTDDDFFEHKLFSCDYGMSKSSDSFFIKAAEVFKVRPDDILFVDDDEKNLEVAQSVGLQTFHYTWNSHEELKEITDSFFSSLNIV